MAFGRRRPSFPVGLHLAVFGLALVLPVLLFCALVLRSYTTAEERRSDVLAVSAARDLAGLVDRELAAHFARLEALAAIYGSAGPDAAQLREKLRAVEPYEDAPIALLSLSADAGASGEGWMQPLVATLASAGRGGRQRLASNLVTAPDRSRKILLAVPVGGATGERRVVAMILPIERLRPLVTQAAHEPVWRAAIVDQGGLVLSRSYRSEGFEGKRVPWTVGEASNAVVIRSPSMDGGEVYRAAVRTELAPWHAVISLPVSIVEAPLRRTWLVFGLAGAALLGLSLMMAFLYGRTLAGPMRAAARAAADLGRGRQIRPQRSVVSEVNEVSEALLSASLARSEAEAAIAMANERTGLALQAGRMGTFDADLESGTIHNSPERLRIFGVDPITFDGRLATLDALIHPDDVANVMERRRKAREEMRPFETEFRIIRPDGATRWILSRAQFHRAGDGTPRFMFGVTLDITSRKIVERDLADAAARASRQLKELEALYASAPIGLALFDRELRSVRINSAMAEMHRLPPQEPFGQTVRQALGAIADTIEPHLRRVLETGQSMVDVEIQVETPAEPGETRYFRSHYYPLLDEDGLIAGVGLIVEETTDDKRAAERQKLLIRELRHRANNMLAVIQSVARRSLSGERPLAEARVDLLDRLQALARAHNMLTDSDWRGVSLRALVRLELDGLDERARIEGPEVILGSGPAQTFALVLHELAINALKHGALSVPRGRVDVEWRVTGTGPSARFVFTWRELGGPPVDPPRRRGFGTELLERAIVEDFDKPARIDFRPEGLLFEIDVPYAVIRMS